MKRSFSSKVTGLSFYLSDMSEGEARCPVKHNLVQNEVAPSKCPINHGHMRTMKAARVHGYGGLEQIVIDQIPIPFPGDNEVVVRLFTIGVNPCDILVREGKLLTKTLPFTLGLDGSGIVDSVGKHVTKLKAGERVYVSLSLTGTYAEYCLTKEHWVQRLHDNLSFSQGAALPIPYFTAYKALFMVGKAKPGQTVLVHGVSGGVGVACCQLARAYGLRVVATTGTEEGRTVVLESGAHIAICHHDSGYIEYLKAVTRNEGYHVILEMAASRNLHNDLGLLREKGTVVVVGSNGKIEIDPAMLIIGQTQIKGVNTLTQEVEEISEISAAIYSGMQQGWLKPVIVTEFPLTDVVEALKRLEDPSDDRHGSIIMSPV